jgi:protein-disulfide isomerase
MKIFLTAATATIALTLAGCGGEGTKAPTPAEGGTANTAAIPAPNGGDWAETVTQTPEGGFLMGNPDAPVKVVEYASMTCSHCADFSTNAMPLLVQNYIKTGQVSLELRNFVRDPADLAAALLARCGGAAPFFKLTEQMFAAQGDWIGKLQQMSQADQQALSTAAPEQVIGKMADQADLVQFVRVRGIPEERARACLADEAALKQLVSMNEAATRDYQVQGTPTFLINGAVVPNTADWATLEPKIREAIG